MIFSLVSRPALNTIVKYNNLTFGTNTCPFSNWLLVQLCNKIVYLCTNFISNRPLIVSRTAKKEDCNQIMTDAFLSHRILILYLLEKTLLSLLVHEF